MVINKKIVRCFCVDVNISKIAVLLGHNQNAYEVFRLASGAPEG